MFYVELPGDEYGNTGHGLYVIEATTETDERGKEWLHVTAPPEFARKWPSLFRHVHGGWKETEGPARLLTEDEWAQLTGFRGVTMTPDDPASATLARIRAAIEAASPGDWEAHVSDAGTSYEMHDIWRGDEMEYVAQDCTEADGAFIVTARKVMPLLVAAVEAVLEMAGDWDRETVKLDLKADQADRTVPRVRNASALMSARAQALEGCGREVRGAITAALAGTGKEGSNEH